MNEIFISYCRRDKVFVERFLAGLKENGYSSDNIWVDWEDIPASSDWEAEIKKGIETANSIIFILSPEWAKSGECAKELRFATEYNKRLFPIVWQNVDPNTIQKELGSLNWIFFRETDDFDAAMQKLLAALKTDLGWVAQHTTLLTRANEWNAKNRDNGYLLHGSELQEAETWLSQASEDKQPQPSPLQKEYIFTSRQEDVRRQRRNLILVSTAMVVSIALAIMAVISWVSALRQSQKALASELAAKSSGLVNTQPDLALLLSLEANYIGDELGESDAASLGSLITSLNSSPKLGTYLRGHQSDVRALAFSPDGRWLATAGGIPTGESGEVYLWDLNAGTNNSQKLNTGNTNRFLAVAFSTDSKTFVAAGDGKQLFIWNTEKCCDPIQQWDVSENVRAIKFVTVNGREYVAAATGNQVSFWDIANGKKQDALTLQIEAVNKDVRVLSLAFSPTTHELAAGNADGSVTVWDLKSRELKFRVCSYGAVAANGPTPCDAVDDTEVKEIRGLAFNADATLLLSGSSDQRARLWDAQTGELLAQTPDRNEGGHINTVTSVAFNPTKERQVATVSWDNTVRLWDLIQIDDTWSFHHTDTLAGHANSIWATAFSPNGTWLASGSSDYSVILWKVNQNNQIGTPVAQMDGHVWALTVSPHGDQFAAGDEAGNIRIWKFDGKILSDPITLIHPGGVLTLAYSHDGKWLASAGYDKTILVWDAQTGKEAWSIEKAHDDEIWSLMFSPDDAILASASFDTTVKLWNTSTHAVLNTLKHERGVFALAFNDDGSELLVAGFEADIHLWDLTDIAAVRDETLPKGHIYSVNSLAYNQKFPPLLASTSDDKTLLVWNVDEKERTPPVLGLNESMEAVTFRPSGDWLASATDNNTVLLWKLDSQRCSEKWDKDTCQPDRLGEQLVGHQQPVQNVVFLSDTKLISSSADGQLILWDLDKGFWYQKACDIVNRPFSKPEYSQYIEDKINTTLLNTVNWFADRFGSGTLEEAPSCIVDSLP